MTTHTLPHLFATDGNEPLRQWVLLPQLIACHQTKPPMRAIIWMQQGAQRGTGWQRGAQGRKTVCTSLKEKKEKRKQERDTHTHHMVVIL